MLFLSCCVLFKCDQVQLDTSRTLRVVFGEEQMFDVELDRNTEFRQKRTCENTVPWDGEGDYQETEATGQCIFRTDARKEDGWHWLCRNK